MLGHSLERYVSYPFAIERPTGGQIGALEQYNVRSLADYVSHLQAMGRARANILGQHIQNFVQSTANPVTSGRRDRRSYGQHRAIDPQSPENWLSAIWFASPHQTVDTSPRSRPAHCSGPDQSPDKRFAKSANHERKPHFRCWGRTAYFPTQPGQIDRYALDQTESIWPGYLCLQGPRSLQTAQPLYELDHLHLGR